MSFERSPLLKLLVVITFANLSFFVKSEESTRTTTNLRTVVKEAFQEEGLEIEKQITQLLSDNNSEQSPIKIIPDQAHAIHQNLLRINYSSLIGQFIFLAKDQGDTFRLTIPENDYSYEVEYLNLQSGIRTSYFLRNVHLHVPEEHYIDSNKYPIEFHFVHSSKESIPHSNLVFGIIGRAESDISKVDVSLKSINLTPNFLSTIYVDFLKTQSYYFYKGSLTTPPYSENVLWFVFTRVVAVSQRVITTAQNSLKTNARPTQENKNEVFIFNNQQTK